MAKLYKLFTFKFLISVVCDAIFAKMSHAMLKRKDRVFKKLKAMLGWNNIISATCLNLISEPAIDIFRSSNTLKWKLGMNDQTKHYQQLTHGRRYQIKALLDNNGTDLRKKRR